MRYSRGLLVTAVALRLVARAGVVQADVLDHLLQTAQAPAGKP